MEQVWRSYSQAVPLLMQHMALYLAPFRPDGIGLNLYERFIKNVKKRGLLHKLNLSTLNYELLLDYAVSSAGERIDYWGTGRNGDVPLLKLHGSCNFLPSQISATRGVTFTAGVTFDGGIAPASDANAVVAFCLADNALYPAMSLYMPGKHVQVGGAAIADVQITWAELVGQAAKVLTIGVNPFPEDEHVWGPLSNTTAMMGHVGNKAHFEAWVTGHRPKSRRSVFLGSSWSASFDAALSFLEETSDAR